VLGLTEVEGEADGEAEVLGLTETLGEVDGD
jgi:hypothetical protein